MIGHVDKKKKSCNLGILIGVKKKRLWTYCLEKSYAASF